MSASYMMITLPAPTAITLPLFLMFLLSSTIAVLSSTRLTCQLLLNHLTST